MHGNNRYPSTIPQSQPKEGLGTYFQQNFPQKPLSFNASINNPRLQVLTSPWRMDEHGENNVGGNGISGEIQTGYKLDFFRTNSTINHKLNKDRNKLDKVRQMTPDLCIDITEYNPNEYAVSENQGYYKTGSSNEQGYYADVSKNQGYYAGSSNEQGYYKADSSMSQGYYADSSTNQGYYAIPSDNQGYSTALQLSARRDGNTGSPQYYFTTSEDLDGYYYGIQESYNTPRYSNMTFSSLNDYSFDSANHKTKFNRPISQQTVPQGYYADSEIIDSSFFDPVDVKKHDKTIIVDKDDISMTDYPSKSYEQFCFNANKQVTKKPVQTYNPERRRRDIKNKEKFEVPCRDNLDEMYQHILEARANAILTYLLKDPSFNPWRPQWELLKKNINKCNMDFKQLNDSHEDVAYSLDKGKELSFRFRDKDKYMPLSVETYILAHEMAHVANEEVGHGDKFQEIMHVIEVAAYILKFIDLSKYPDNKVIYSNGQEIMSKRSMIYELTKGIETIIQRNPEPARKEYWERILNRIRSGR